MRLATQRPPHKPATTVEPPSEAVPPRRPPRTVRRTRILPQRTQMSPTTTPQFEPIVSLPEQEIKALEDDEEELFFKVRAKLFRFASEDDLPGWKERGTGDVNLPKHKARGTIRLLTRRDQTMKLRANRCITPVMELKPDTGGGRAWVWSAHTDFADERPKPGLHAIRFLNAENAQEFKTTFEECRKEIEEREKKGPGKNDNGEKVAEKLEARSVREAGDEAVGKSEEKR